MSETEASLAEWLINNYIRKCAQRCPDNVSRLFDDESKAVSAIIDYIRCVSQLFPPGMFIGAQFEIASTVSHFSLTVRSCLRCTRDLVKIDQCLCMYFIAVTFLHVVRKTTKKSIDG